MFDGRWREAVDRRTAPVGEALERHGVTADVLTATGLLSALATALAVASGHLHLAIGLLTLTGLHDLLDGPVAKAAGTVSVRGAFFDSVVDRVADAVVMGGVTWYLVSTHRGHLALLPLAVLAVTSLVSYQRAKAEALGLGGATGGRMVLLGAGFLSAALWVPDLWVLLGLTTLTAAGRFVRVWRSAEGPVRSAPAERGRPRWREGRVDSRWRAWREGRARGAEGTTASGFRWRARRGEAPLASRARRLRRARGQRARAGGSSGSVS